MSHSKTNASVVSVYPGQDKTQFLSFSLNMLSAPACSAKLYGLITTPEWCCGAYRRRRTRWLNGKHKNQGRGLKCLSWDPVDLQPQSACKALAKIGDLRCHGLCIRDFVQQTNWLIYPAVVRLAYQMLYIPLNPSGWTEQSC